MEEETKKRRVIGRPFTRGDPRINRRGRPKSFDELRRLAVAIACEVVTDDVGNKITLLEGVLRSLACSKDPQAKRVFLEYAYGRPPDKIETTGLEDKKTLILHYHHELEGKRHLLGNENYPR
jgi:hypothetical protein